MTTETTSTLTVRGQALRVDVRPGDPAWPPLLLCNGIGASLEVLQPFVDALDPRREVIRFDLPGIGGLLAGAGWTSLPLLPLLRRPVLVLAGDDDPLIPLVNGHIMHRLIAGSELHVYRGGHLDLIAEPHRLAPVIERFLRADAAADRKAI